MYILSQDTFICFKKRKALKGMVRRQMYGENKYTVKMPKSLSSQRLFSLIFIYIKVPIAAVWRELKTSFKCFH